jgi:hypothetical protein
MRPLLFLLALAASASAVPVINEFVAENHHGLADQDGPARIGSKSIIPIRRP